MHTPHQVSSDASMPHAVQRRGHGDAALLSHCNTVCLTFSDPVANLGCVLFHSRSASAASQIAIPPCCQRSSLKALRSTSLLLFPCPATLALALDTLYFSSSCLRSTQLCHLELVRLTIPSAKPTCMRHCCSFELAVAPAANIADVLLVSIVPMLVWPLAGVDSTLSQTFSS
jgi:hypothetical protein